MLLSKRKGVDWMSPKRTPEGTDVRGKRSGCGGQGGIGAWESKGGGDGEKIREGREETKKERGTEEQFGCPQLFEGCFLRNGANGAMPDVLRSRKEQVESRERRGRRKGHLVVRCWCIWPSFFPISFLFWRRRGAPRGALRYSTFSVAETEGTSRGQVQCLGSVGFGRVAADGDLYSYRFTALGAACLNQSVRERQLQMSVSLQGTNISAASALMLSDVLRIFRLLMVLSPAVVRSEYAPSRTEQDVPVRSLHLPHLASRRPIGPALSTAVRDGATFATAVSSAARGIELLLALSR
jgi:hypothetical protein